MWPIFSKGVILFMFDIIVHKSYALSHKLKGASTMPSIAAFLSFACIMSFTPGPNNIMALSSASAYGLRKGLRFCFGVLLGVLFRDP